MTDGVFVLESTWRRIHGAAKGAAHEAVEHWLAGESGDTEIDDEGGELRDLFATFAEPLEVLEQHIAAVVEAAARGVYKAIGSYQQHNLPEILTARRRLADAMHAMHADKQILVDPDLAEYLDRAWRFYDAALLGALPNDFAFEGVPQMTSTTRTVHFTAPPPAEVAERCERSADLVNRVCEELRSQSRVELDTDRMIEDLRGVVVDLVLANGWLIGALASHPEDELNRTDDDGLVGALHG